MIPFNELVQALERHKRQREGGVVPEAVSPGKHTGRNAGPGSENSAEIPLDEVEEN
jgi:hypothetical protein